MDSSTDVKYKFKINFEFFVISHSNEMIYKKNTHTDFERTNK